MDEASATTTPGAIIRSEDFWFEDGNIILQVETWQFRIHRGILAAKSNVFDDLFNVPQPTDQPLVEGCPLVYMPDSLEDWDNLLAILYRPESLFLVNTTLPLSFLISMLRLGKKYQFDHVRNNALARLKSEFPSGIVKYDEFRRIHKPHKCDKKAGGCQSILCSEPWNLVDIINLGLEQGIYSVLPFTYYLCALEDPMEIANGVQRPAGTIAKLHQDPLVTLLLGREKIRKAALAVSLTQYFTDPTNSKHCMKTHVCPAILQSNGEATGHQMNKDLSSALDPMDTGVLDSLCANCLPRVKVFHDRGRKYLLDNLPSYFPVPEVDL